MKFSHATLFEGHKHMMTNFLSLSKLWCGPQGINSREIHLHLSFYVKCNIREKVWKKKTREFILILMFTLPLPQSLLKRPMLMNEFPLVLPQTLMIEVRKVSWLVGIIVYSAKHCGFKRNRINSIHFRLRIQTTKDLTKSGRFYFGFTHLRVNKKLNPAPKFSGFSRIHQEFGKITASLRVLTQNLKQSILNIMLKTYIIYERA